MKTLIVYDSYFGNTKQIAYALSEVFDPADVKICRVSDCQNEDLQGVDLLIVGSPTRGFRPTEATGKFLDQLASEALQGKKIMAFDTRIHMDKINNRFLKMMAKRFGYAAEPIVKKLQEKGGVPLGEAAGFYVKDSEGPLQEGELARAAEWLKEAIF